MIRPALLCVSLASCAGNASSSAATLKSSTQLIASGSTVLAVVAALCVVGLVFLVAIGANGQP